MYFLSCTPVHFHALLKKSELKVLLSRCCFENYPAAIFQDLKPEYKRPSFCTFPHGFSVVLTGMHLWRTKYHSFIVGTQMDFATRLIVVPLTTFHRLSEVIGDPEGELIFLFHTVRSGSTLLSQVKQ